jgi:hypothetical protein
MTQGYLVLRFLGGFPFRLDGLDASLSISDVRFEAAGWNRIVTYAEVFGNRSKDNWLKEKAVSRAKDEVLAALVEYKRAEIKHLSVSEYITSFKKNTVLILGDYDDEGIKRLTMIADISSKLGYEPLLLKDVPDHPYHDLSQKLVAIGAIARFIVVDDSSKSGHLSEVEICKQNKWVTILLRAEGQGGSWMTAGASYLSNVIFEKDYNLSSPGLAVKEAVDWAERKLHELQRKFDNTYPWRIVHS